MISYFKEKTDRINTLLNNSIVCTSGTVELTFISNPNHQGSNEFDIREKTSIIGNVPTTLNWETVNQYTDKSKEWFILERALSNTDGRYYNICKYKEEKIFSINGNNYNIIEEARKHAEIQELTNKNVDLSQFYITNEFTPLLNKYYALASIGDGNSIIVFFNDVKEVLGLYPYNMGIIKVKGKEKAMRLKGKKVVLNIEILDTKTEIIGGEVITHQIGVIV